MRFLFILTVCLFASCTKQAYYTGYNKGLKTKMLQEPGKCYVKAIMPDIYERIEETYNEYTGTNTEQADVSAISVVTKAGGQRWVKKKADRNCLTADPEDCLVWCLVKLDDETETFFQVIDTSIVKDFKERQVIKQKFISKGGQAEWVETLCENEISSSFIKRFQEVLLDEGMLGDLPRMGSIDENTKMALVQYQGKYNLPNGGLNLITLEYMGVKP